jgi:hypothetical protein
LENTPPPGRGNIGQCHLGENMKIRKGKGGKCERKRRKTKDKGKLKLNA